MAEGGMGIVYEAIHLQLQERVAIKVLRPDAARSRDGKELAARFLREARATIKIRSEHVVRVLDVATLDDGVPCIVMEHLDGVDLERHLADSGPIRPQEAVDHVLQACEALAEAHVLGIVHRDLKPANLFLARRADGTPSIKVLDFGISKLLGTGNVRLTGKHDVMGSPRYMSPEQMRASTTLDTRTDVWSLGVILYELITGVPPFDGEAVTEVCASILSDPPSPVLSKATGIPPGLEGIILRCLEKKPAKRFQDVGELAAALAVFGSEGSDASAACVARVLHKAALPIVRAGLGPGGVSAMSESQRARSWNATTASVSVPSAPHASTAGLRRLGIVAVLSAAVVGAVTVTLLRRSHALAAMSSPEPARVVAPASAPPAVVPLPDDIPPPPSDTPPDTSMADTEVTVPALARSAAAPASAADLTRASAATPSGSAQLPTVAAPPPRPGPPRAAASHARAVTKGAPSPRPQGAAADLWGERK